MSLEGIEAIATKDGKEAHTLPLILARQGRKKPSQPMAAADPFVSTLPLTPAASPDIATHIADVSRGKSLVAKAQQLSHVVGARIRGSRHRHDPCGGNKQVAERERTAG